MDRNEEPKLVRHATLYLPFGDLVVQSAPDEDGVATLFCVNKTLLAYNSLVFAGMFTFPAPVDERDMHDGMASVRLSDSAQDLSALFSALYNPSSLSFPRYDADIPILLTGVMRLATKYQFDAIRARIIDIMHESWPRSFEQWLRFRSELAVIQKAHADEEDGLVDEKTYEERIPEPAAAIKFAREFDVPSILSLALYTLAGISPNLSWDEIREEKWTELRVDRSKNHIVTARWNLLQLIDYQCLVKCKTGLALDVELIINQYTSYAWLITHVFTKPRECAHVGNTCDNALRRIGETVTNLYLDEAVLYEGRMAPAFSTPNPLELLEQLEAFSSSTTLGLCRGCQVPLLSSLRGSKEFIWDRI